MPQQKDTDLPRRYEAHTAQEGPQGAQELPENIAQHAMTKSPAHWAYERIVLYIQAFEKDLDADHEVAMGFAGSDQGVLRIEPLHDNDCAAHSTCQANRRLRGRMIKRRIALLADVVTAGFKMIGVLTGGTINPTAVMRKSIRLQGVYVGNRRMFHEMNAAFSLNQVHPVIDQVFEFEDAPDAYRAMQAAGHFGKLVVKVESEIAVRLHGEL